MDFRYDFIIDTLKAKIGMKSLKKELSSADMALNKTQSRISNNVVGYQAEAAAAESYYRRIRGQRANYSASEIRAAKVEMKFKKELASISDVMARDPSYYSDQQKGMARLKQDMASLTKLRNEYGRNPTANRREMIQMDWEIRRLNNVRRQRMENMELLRRQQNMDRNRASFQRNLTDSASKFNAKNFTKAANAFDRMVGGSKAIRIGLSPVNALLRTMFDRLVQVYLLFASIEKVIQGIRDVWSSAVNTEKFTQSMSVFLGSQENALRTLQKYRKDAIMGNSPWSGQSATEGKALLGRMGLTDKDFSKISGMAGKVGVDINVASQDVVDFIRGNRAALEKYGVMSEKLGWMDMYKDPMSYRQAAMGFIRSTNLWTGGTADQMNTWTGIITRISEVWEDFKNKVMGDPNDKNSLFYSFKQGFKSLGDFLSTNLTKIRKVADGFRILVQYIWDIAKKVGKSILESLFGKDGKGMLDDFRTNVMRFVVWLEYMRIKLMRFWKEHGDMIMSVAKMIGAVWVGSAAVSGAAGMVKGGVDLANNLKFLGSFVGSTGAWMLTNPLGQVIALLGVIAWAVVGTYKIATGRYPWEDERTPSAASYMEQYGTPNSFQQVAMASQQVMKDKATQAAGARFDKEMSQSYRKAGMNPNDLGIYDRLSDAIVRGVTVAMAGFNAPSVEAEEAYGGGTHIYINGKLYKRIESPDPNRGGTKAK